jgi:hypothetical protein
MVAVNLFIFNFILFIWFSDLFFFSTTELLVIFLIALFFFLVFFFFYVSWFKHVVQYTVSADRDLISAIYSVVSRLGVAIQHIEVNLSLLNKISASSVEIFSASFGSSDNELDLLSKTYPSVVYLQIETLVRKNVSHFYMLLRIHLNFLFNQELNLIKNSVLAAFNDNSYEELMFENSNFAISNSVDSNSTTRPNVKDNGILALMVFGSLIEESDRVSNGLRFESDFVQFSTFSYDSFLYFLI